MKPELDLPTLRQHIRQVDEDLMHLIARRMDLARQVGEAKLAQNLPIKDYRVEKEVIEKSRKRARELGIYEDLAEEISKTLIKYSCWLQDEYHGKSRRRAQAPKRKILIVGGLGPMGKWLAEFFEAFGHAIELQDLRAPTKEEDTAYLITRDMDAAAKRAEIVILATPISATAQVIARLAETGTPALVFDICSLKSPLLDAIEKATQGGLRFTSIHPMFGPRVELLVGRNILLCETGKPEWTDEAAELFTESTANLIRLPLLQHDELVGYILGLSHLVNLAFACTLTRSGIPFATLQTIGSTTFTAQTQVTEAVVRENQDLYYEIQSQNRWTPELLEKMRLALDAYAKTIVEKDRGSFKSLMEASRVYFNLQGKASGPEAAAPPRKQRP